MTRATLDLSEVPTPTLERLREQLRTGRLTCPPSAFDLRAAGLASLEPHADALRAFSATSLAMLVDALLHERAKAGGPTLELVWTGPEARVSTARDTAVVVRELFASARSSILIAGFRFDHGAELLKPVHESMKSRGVSCAVFADGPAAETFISREWPFGPPFPDLYVDAREDARFSSVHSKCVVIDAERAFVTSANFTDRGQHRNVEVGLLVRDPALAGTLHQQWMGLVGAGYFHRKALM